jgi:hypothetical protein
MRIANLFRFAHVRYTSIRRVTAMKREQNGSREIPRLRSGFRLRTPTRLTPRSRPLRSNNSLARDARDSGNRREQLVLPSLVYTVYH